MNADGFARNFACASARLACGALFLATMAASLPVQSKETTDDWMPAFIHVTDDVFASITRGEMGRRLRNAGVAHACDFQDLAGSAMAVYPPHQADGKTERPKVP